MQASAIAWFLLLLLAFVWGSSFILMYEGLFDSAHRPLYSSWEVGAMRIGFAGLALAPVAWVRRNRVTWGEYGWMAAVGLIGNTIPAFCFTFAETELDSNFAGILNGLTPLFALVIGSVAFRSPVRLLQVLGIVIGLGGAVGLIALNGVGGEAPVVHVAVVVLATLCYGLSVNIISHKLVGVPSATIAAFALITGGLPCAVYVVACSNAPAVLLEHPEGGIGLLAIAVLGIVGTALALVLFNRLIAMTSGLFGASVTYLIPVVAVGWGMAYGEHITAMHLLWTAVIFSGVYLVNRGKRVQVSESSKSY